MPATDSGLGYILASLSPATPIAYVDISSTARVHFWRSRSSEKFLRAGNLVIMHGAKDWADHFAWAACVVRELPSGMLERSRGLTGERRVTSPTCCRRDTPATDLLAAGGIQYEQHHEQHEAAEDKGD